MIYFSVCCNARAIESHRPDPRYRGREMREMYECESCMEECELFDEEKGKVEMKKLSGLRATVQYFIAQMQPKLVGKYFDINCPIGF